ncbi:hypothetical protein Selin_1998 [Desulfurispirillum indicum S5]|uniref:Transposase IS200-like domain-containing protein n=1 Tax=Desulfurispirillum indicum (strain ATCC BAA-1389 / DSM 22839 / S5) TaxID=653733 RepID=E6W2H0_DESIS|nr:hypothetical protein [Desulfurispirillum indicum]ADU66720.1 hypothetical protein Selin_1998 [Desulfurispirillum indicum S5]
MTIARSQIIALDSTPYYHCVSRCVRRAFLCGVDSVTGQSFDHRKQWILDRLGVLTEVFAIDICAYALMSNHYHLVLRVDRERVEAMSDYEVLGRWNVLFSGNPLIKMFLAGQKLSAVQEQMLAALIRDIRPRLYDISWFMRSLNEWIARQANKEDNCKGRFWEGRFRTQALLDEYGLLTCMAYVDLNAIRAGIADSPEHSDFSSIQARIRAWGEVLGEEAAAQCPPLLGFNDSGTDDALLPFTTVDYMELVDWTARNVRADKACAMDEDAPPILVRMGIDSERFAKQMRGEGGSFPTFMGAYHCLRDAARERGLHYVRGSGTAKRLFCADRAS